MSARVLAIHRYFWPDTPPYAAMLRVIVAHWAGRGHDVRVFTSQPSYKRGVTHERMPARQEIDGVAVRRVRMRPDEGPRGRKLRNMVRFSGFTFLRVLLGPRVDVVMCSTAPQVLLGWMTSCAARLRGAAFIYHCMDLHPEIGRVSGEFAHPWVFRVLQRMDVSTCRRAAAVVVLSDDMREALIDRDASLAGSIHVVNNFDLPDAGDQAGDLPDLGTDARLTLCFAGNVGRFQGLGTLVRAVLSDDARLDGLRLVLMGEGAAKDDLAGLIDAAPIARRDRVRLLSHGSPAAARRLMQVSDLGLVTLVPGVIRYAYPSKTATYLSEGLPILAGVEEGSALARDVRAWAVGDVLDLASVETVVEQLAAWLNRQHELPAMRARAHEAWLANFSTEERLADWDALLDDVLNERARA